MLTGFSPFQELDSLDNMGVNAELRQLDQSLLDMVPNGSRSLLKGLLHNNPSQRLQLSDVLRHPWLVEQCSGHGTTIAGKAIALPNTPIPLPNLSGALVVPADGFPQTGSETNDAVVSGALQDQLVGRPAESVN